MTKPAETRRCEWCGRSFVPNVIGRPRTYCRPACKQRDYEARRRSVEVGLSESELIVARSQLDELYDALYVLEAAIEDVQKDLAANDDQRALENALDWLLSAARPLVQIRLSSESGPASHASASTSAHATELDHAPATKSGDRVNRSGF